MKDAAESMVLRHGIALWPSLGLQNPTELQNFVDVNDPLSDLQVYSTP